MYSILIKQIRGFEKKQESPDFMSNPSPDLYAEIYHTMTEMYYRVCLTTLYLCCITNK